MILDNTWVRLSPYISRRAAARVLSTLLCAIVVVIRPFSRLGGESAFLAITVKELVFPAQNDLAQQLETTILNITGALVGIGVSALAMFLASLVPYDSSSSRAIQAAFLIALVFCASWMKSRLPRLGLSTRIAMFISIFMLTSEIGVRSRVLSTAGHFLWISLTAAVLSFVSSSMILDWSTAGFAEDIASSFSDLRKSLDATLSCLHTDTQKSFDYGAAQSTLLKKSVALNANYQQVLFELRIGRLSVKSVKPLVNVIEHLRRELAWGMSFDRVATSGVIRPESDTMAALKNSADELGGAILDAMKTVQEVVLAGYKHSSLIQSRTAYDQASVENMQQRLEHCHHAVQGRLCAMADAVYLNQRIVDDSKIELSRDLFDVCLFMVSLLQMGHELRNALRIAHRINALCASGRTRLWLPKLSSAWLGATPSSYALYEPSYLLSGEPQSGTNQPDSDLSSAEARQGLLENSHTAAAMRDRVDLYTTDLRPSLQDTLSFRRLPELIHSLWSSGPSMRIRFVGSWIVRSAQHSSHLKHALKNAGGVALLTLPAFLDTRAAGNRWFAILHAQWMVITYIWILETSTGATWRSCYLRLTGTVLGAVYAYISWLICRSNPYGLVVMITVADIPITWLVLNTKVAPIGVVASITLPPIMLMHYINPGNAQPVIKLAVDRGLMIGAGIIAALMVNHFVFPRHCRVLFLANASQSLSLLSQLYLSNSRHMIQGGQIYSTSARQITLQRELEIRGALHRLSLLLLAMNDELSLLPKPMGLYRRALTALQRTLDLLTGLRKVRENIPQKETVTEVIKERRELISCICLSFFACEVAFRTRHPLPQFIPSARHAFDVLQGRVEETLHEARQANSHAMGLSLVFAFAESEVLKDLVETLEELLELCRQLFGSSAWLTEPLSQVGTRTDASSDIEDEPVGWYSTTRVDERSEHM